jgi:hypothetical protein
MFELGENSEATMHGITNHSSKSSVEMQCLPLYSLLLALGNPTVDVLSLDIEGAEYQVLQTIPWDRVDIRAISVETQFAGEVMTGSRADIHQLLTSVGFLHLEQISRDDVYVRLEPGGHSPRPMLAEVASKTGRGRGCVLFRVPSSRLETWCQETNPRDFFMQQELEWEPCLTMDTCPR